MLIKRNKEAVEKLQLHVSDTGSSAVQIAVLTERINELNKHLLEHPHDHAGRRGLIMLVGKRRRLSRYLDRIDSSKYRKTVEVLGLRK